MQAIYFSNHGDDRNNGLTEKSPIRSWKRYMTLSRGNQVLVLMEGHATMKRLLKKTAYSRNRHPRSAHGKAD